MPRISLRSLQTATGILAIIFFLWWSTSSSSKEPSAVVFQFDKARKVEPFIPTPNGSWPERAEQSKAMFLRAYHAYEKYAFPADELLPESEEGSQQYVITLGGRF